MTPRPGKEGISVFLVAADAPGITYGAHYKKFGWCGSDTGDIYFKNCRVPKWSLCGQLNKGLRISLGTLDGARLVIAARAVGYAKGAYEKALDYATQRIAFGKPLSDFQVLQHYIADMYSSIQVGEGYLMYLASLLDNGESIAKGASIAKLFCTEEAQKICEKAMQLCGGMGLLKDFGLVPATTRTPACSPRRGHQRDPEEHHLQVHHGRPLSRRRPLRAAPRPGEGGYRP